MSCWGELGKGTQAEGSAYAQAPRPAGLRETEGPRGSKQGVEKRKPTSEKGKGPHGRSMGSTLRAIADTGKSDT